jgi:ribosome-binding factor A
MSQRVAKVESLIQQVVATALLELYPEEAARITVTRVDAAPDLHNATVWVGLLGTEPEQQAIMKGLQWRQREVQSRLMAGMNTKYVPHLHFKLDTGGAYAAEIDQILKKL